MEIRPILSTLRRHKTAAALIVIEIALACAIVSNALFLVSERVDTLRTSSGIAEQELIQIRLGGVGAQTDADARTREDLAALRALPGVNRATVVNQLPFQRNSWNTSLSTSVEDQNAPSLSAAMYMVGEDALPTLGLAMIAGRDFDPGEYWDNSELDGDGATRGWGGPVLVTDAIARQLFPDGGAVGATVYMANFPLTIVGVVETLRRPSSMGGDLDRSVIFPSRLNYGNGGFYLLRADPDRLDEMLAAGVAALERIDPNRLVLNQRPYADIRNAFFANDRDMIGILLLVCGLLLVVTALGIVGLASFWVQQRTRMIGVRRALGATRAQILRYFQTENFLLVTLGIVLGMLLAYGLNQMLMGRYELPRLPLAYLPIGAIVLWLLGQLAVLGPARKAMAIPPAIATRSA